MLTKKTGQPGSKSNKTATLPESSVSNQKAVAQKKDYLPSEKEKSKTRITIKYDAGFPNQLYIRGNGAGLKWDKGTLLKNANTDEWVWETDGPFSTFEFKILINDNQYEVGENHQAHYGANILYSPKFQS